MADEPQLKQLYTDIQTDEREMSQYRTGLKAKLSETTSPWWRQWWMLSLPLAAAAGFLLVLLVPKQGFDAQSVDDLIRMVTEYPQPEDLRERALSLTHNSNPQDANDANLVLTMLSHSPNTEGVTLAANGLLKDPRPEARAFYLEFILDYADEYQFNQDMVEKMLDEENDPLCLDLLREMLKLTQIEHQPIT